MKISLLTPVVLSALGLSATFAHADVKDRLYEFTDAYYRQNGVNPAAIAGRRQADGIRAVLDTPLFSFQRNVRSLFTIGGWTDGGKSTYWTVFGELSGDSFTKDAAGRRALEIAERSPEYVFPRLGTNPISLGATRQPFMIDVRHGYFSNNPLGLWIHVFVNFTDAAFNTKDGKRALADLAKRNGLALDGTPIIRKAGEIDDLSKNGFVTKLTLPFGTSGRYAVCPAIKDPTNGGIARDQTLFTTRRPDGSTLVPEILQNFESLRLTGRWAN